MQYLSQPFCPFFTEKLAFTFAINEQDTAIKTYELYENGLNIDEIAYERGLTAGTIERHLLECLQKGMSIDFGRLYPKEYKPQILEAVKTHGRGSLKAIKDALPADIPYGAIRFAINKHQT